MEDVEIQNRFSYHPPADPSVSDRHALVRGRCGSLCYTLDAQLPEGREKALAITKLEEVMFWANAAIARGGD